MHKADLEEGHYHYVNRSNWVRAAVLGANDGILSVASLAIGVAVASSTREPIILASFAGLIAGALSMAAGEYISVSSQLDIEKSDLEREKKTLQQAPEAELQELAKIYEERGLDEETALEVAKQLTAHDALGAHARDELGINDVSETNPLQAAFASGLAFIAGGVLPLLVCVFSPLKQMMYYQYGFSIIFLILLGAVAAKAGGSSVYKAIARITSWGTIAMGLTAIIGRFFDVNLA